MTGAEETTGQAERPGWMVQLCRGGKSAGDVSPPLWEGREGTVSVFGKALFAGPTGLNTFLDHKIPLRVTSDKTGNTLLGH